MAETEPLERSPAAPPAAQSRGRRCVALLQGPSSYFFDLVGDALIAEGADAFRVCFCLGDRLFWRGKPYVWSREPAEDWPEALRRLIRDRGVTDLLMLGDSRPRHQAAVQVARELGVAAHIVEHGYFRPDWLTHELGGMNLRSRVRRDFLAGRLPAAPPFDPTEPASIYRSSFAAYAAMDVVYNLSNVFSGPLVAPNYRGHSTVWPLVEYAGWIRKLLVASSRARRAAARFSELLASRAPFYLWALQLEADYQIRRDGVGPQRAVLADVVRSFAAHAPNEARLLVKAHPLDNTLIDWRGRLARAAAEAGVADRVHFLDGGDLEAMLARAEGVFSVNSTVGLRAVALGRRTLALGRAIYAAPGLAQSGGLPALNRFWRSTERPDPDSAARFLTALRERAQFRGAFDGEGAEPGAETLARRILREPPG